MKKVYIGLGSNLLEPSQQLRHAVYRLAKMDEVRLCKASSFYRSKPIGPQDQPDFINAVVELETALEAEQLLDRLQRIEIQQGRVRNERWGARTLDLDILLYGQLQLKTERLTIPHKEIKNRCFVLAPLAELDPTLNIPCLGPIMKQLKLHQHSDAEKISE